MMCGPTSGWRAWPTPSCAAGPTRAAREPHERRPTPSCCGHALRGHPRRHGRGAGAAPAARGGPRGRGGPARRRPPRRARGHDRLRRRWWRSAARWSRTGRLRLLEAIAGAIADEVLAATGGRWRSRSGCASSPCPSTRTWTSPRWSSAGPFAEAAHGRRRALGQAWLAAGAQGQSVSSRSVPPRSTETRSGPATPAGTGRGCRRAGARSRCAGRRWP